MGETVTMWSVRDATTKGKIEEVVGTINGPARQAYLRPENNRWHMYHIGTDVFHTREEAEKVARVNVAKRKASLERSLAKIAKNPFLDMPA